MCSASNELALLDRNETAFFFFKGEGYWSKQHTVLFLSNGFLIEVVGIKDQRITKKSYSYNFKWVSDTGLMIETVFYGIFKKFYEAFFLRKVIGLRILNIQGNNLGLLDLI